MGSGVVGGVCGGRRAATATGGTQGEQRTKCSECRGCVCAVEWQWCGCGRVVWCGWPSWFGDG